MTIEFVVAFPVMLIVAAIAVNACSFFGDVAQSCSLIEQELQQGGNAKNVQVQVSARSVAQGHTAFSATVRFEPTLFGAALNPQVFGVSLPTLSHSEEIVVDCYKPGVLS